MSDPLQEPIAVLCDEVGVPVPARDARGAYVIIVQGQELRVFSLNNGRVIMLGIIGPAGDLASRRKEPLGALLTNCLALQAVRFGRLATQEVLTVEPETGELVLWQAFDAPSLSVPAFLQSAESLLNELEFWKNWLAAS